MCHIHFKVLLGNEFNNFIFQSMIFSKICGSCVIKRASHNAVLKYNGTIAKSSKEKAELFNLYFSSVFSTPDVNTNYDNEINSPETVTSLAEFEICVDEVNE